jgi:ATP-dependent Clp protease adapter protein ClpS
MATDLEIDYDIQLLTNEIEKQEKRFKLILFNDDYHSMGAVVKQLIRALQCTSAQAMVFMKEAHHTGSSVVKVGGEEECKKARRILEEIDLATDLVEESA